MREAGPRLTIGALACVAIGWEAILPLLSCGAILAVSAPLTGYERITRFRVVQRALAQAVLSSVELDRSLESARSRLPVDESQSPLQSYLTPFLPEVLSSEPSVIGLQRTYRSLRARMTRVREWAQSQGCVFESVR